MHAHKDAETDSTLDLEFSDSIFRTRTLGFRVSDLDSPIQNLKLELADSDFRTRTLGFGMSDLKLSDSELSSSNSRTGTVRDRSKSHFQIQILGLALSYSRSRTWILELRLSNLESLIRFLQFDLLELHFRTRTFVFELSN